jgi:hypothetical protein
MHDPSKSRGVTPQKPNPDRASKHPYDSFFINRCIGHLVSYPVFIRKPSTYRMHDLGSVVLHILPKVFTGNQMSRIKNNYYYINSVSKDYDESQRHETAKDSITPQE